MVFKYQSLGFIRKEEKKKNKLLKTSVNAHDPDFFFAIKMQTKNLAVAQNARILPALPLRLGHSNSSAIPKAQKKGKNTHQHSLETGYL